MTNTLKRQGFAAVLAASLFLTACSSGGGGKDLVTTDLGQVRVDGPTTTVVAPPGWIDRDESDSSDGATAHGEGTAIEILDVFEDDGTVRPSYKSAVSRESNPSEVVCSNVTEAGSNLRQCGQESSGWYIGKCSVGGGSAYCPTVYPSGEVSISSYGFKGHIDNYSFHRKFISTEPLMFDEPLPAAVVDTDGTTYYQHFIPDRPIDSHRYISGELDGDIIRFHQPPAGLRAPNGEFPLDTSAPTWTAEFATGYNAEKDRKTIPIKRVYYVE